MFVCENMDFSINPPLEDIKQLQICDVTVLLIGLSQDELEPVKRLTLLKQRV